MPPRQFAGLVGSVRCALFTLAVAVATWPGTAHGEEPRPRPRVSVEIRGCGPELAGRIRELVALELRALIVAAGSDPTGTTQAVVSCHDTLVELSVADPLTGKTLQRPVSLLETRRETRARLLALAVAELVTASWSELVTNPKPSLPLATPPPNVEQANAARDVVRARSPELSARKPAFRVGLALEARSFFAHAGEAWGGGLRVLLPLGRVFFGADAVYDIGSRSRTAGRVSVEAWSGSASFGLEQPIGFLKAQLALGARCGYARMRGETNASDIRGATVQGTWAGPLVRLDVVLPTEPVAVWVGGEGGFAMVRVRGFETKGQATSLEGVWATAQLGVYLTP